MISAYDYSEIRKIVDVGGGHGAVISMILNAYPRMRGVLFDTPSVIEGAKAQIEAAGLASRCEVVAGDFFKSVPEGGDAYILSKIIHDWPDARALVILKNCSRAMARNGKLVVIDQVIPPGNEPSPGKMLDILMLLLLGSQERTEAEFRALFASAGLRLTKVIRTNASADVVEAVRA
ncbi:MAG TPA: methyltransferase [bacterium]|nr:methyltransferase [bacterium]